MIRPAIIGAAIAAVVVAGFNALTPADSVTGPARVIDGDTIEIDGTRIRLAGVAAPERNEPGGPEATETLRQIIDGRPVRCSLTGERTYNRQVGTCWIDWQDIGAALIIRGKARDCPRYSDGTYALIEPDAAKALPLPEYCRPR